MLRGENIVCGTSTTGTGTLTLAATPAPPGGVDFNAWLKATGIGFVSGNAILVSYTIIEYTDSTFATVKFLEKGIGTLTLGAALVNATLARTTVQTVSNANADSYQVGGAASAITIGTAANVLVFVGASAADIPAWSPYFETGIGDNLGVAPLGSSGAGGAASGTLVTLKDYYTLFEWRCPMLVKKASVRVSAAASGTTNAYARIYAVNSSGRPGKLLIDFGVLGTGGSSLNSGTTTISSAVHSTGFYLIPGEYFFDFLPSFSTGSPTMLGPSAGVASSFGRLGSSTLIPFGVTTATSGTAGTAPDPANTTSYAGVAGTGAANSQFSFGLAPS